MPEVVGRFSELSMDASVAVVLAARLYQQAIWTAESNPAYAWLLLVSAIESAAVYWRKQEDTPVERMRASRPELEEILYASGGSALVSRVAELIAPYMGATKRFVDFTLRFLPTPPPMRPPEYQQHPWNQSALKKSLLRIYGHRSTALHAGIPFPAPMCWPQRRSGDAYDERPGIGGAAAAQGDHVWLARDIPMTLQFFEHIARGALLNWWMSLMTSSEG